MLIESVTTIYFSPTGTTKKIINSIVKGMDIQSKQIIDLTLPKNRVAEVPSITGDIVLIGVPVYEERIPEIVYEILENLKGNGKPVVIVSVYGNIGDGITLNQLDYLTENAGFKLVAAGSFVAEHSFSTNETPVAQNHPDEYDLKTAETFGKNIINKLKGINDLKDISIKIPKGKLPIMAKILPKNSARLFTYPPSADMNICNHCNACVTLCPGGAIDNKSFEIDEALCLRCFCCVKRCPKNARRIIYKHKFIVSKVLTMKSKVLKEPKIYL
ncbi:MAG: EFR1 family ferrodoxin [Solirubrobacterales bacterium]